MASGRFTPFSHAGHGQPRVSCTVSVFSIHQMRRMTNPQSTPEAVVWVAIDIAKDRHDVALRMDSQGAKPESDLQSRTSATSLVADF
jgi:hypothetical protein